MRTSPWLKVIGWSEVLGGAAGFVLLPVTLMQQRQPGFPPGGRVPPAWYAMGAVAFAASLVAGVLLLRGRPLGARLSAGLQALQVVQVGTQAFVYQYVTGLQVLLLVTPGGWRLSPGVNVGFAALPPPGPYPAWSLGINFFALAALAVLLRGGATAAPRPGAPPAPSP